MKCEHEFIEVETKPYQRNPGDMDMTQVFKLCKKCGRNSYEILLEEKLETLKLLLGNIGKLV